jgi:hypothetical protein
VTVTKRRVPVRFEHDTNWLADGTYVDAIVDVVVAQLTVRGEKHLPSPPDAGQVARATTGARFTRSYN